jgi:hypothetical protein
MTFLDKGDYATAQLHRMWLAHSDPLYVAKQGNHKPINMGILNHMGDDTL